MRIDIHSLDKRYATAIRGLENDRKVSKRNKELIKKFIEMKHSGLADKTRDIHNLRLLAKHMTKDFDKVRNGDMHKLITRFETGEIKKADGTNYKSVGKLIKTAKSFYTKLLKKPKVMENLKSRTQLKDLKQSDFWPREKILQFPNHASDLKSKALTSLLVLGCNISEYGRLVVSDIIIGEEYIKVQIRNSKNKHRTRTLYLFENMPHIVNWLESHPLRDSEEWPEVPVFVGKYGKNWRPLSYNCLCNIIKRVARKVVGSGRATC